MTTDRQRRLLDLFESCSQETLTENEHCELQAVLQADVEARKLWFLHQDLELGLKCLTQVPEAHEGLLEEGTLISMRSAGAEIAPGRRLPPSGIDSSRVSWVGRRNLTITAAALLCMSALVTIGVQSWWRPSVEEHSVGNKVVNNRAASFVVDSPTHGTKFAMSEQKGKVVAVHFLLKTECPFCLKLVHDYAVKATSNPDVLHLFLKPDSTDEIKVWARKISKDGLKTPPVIFRDPDSRLAKEFGIPDGYQFHGETVHYPALIVLDGSGMELFRYVGKDNSDRMRPDDFTTRLAMVTDRK